MAPVAGPTVVELLDEAALGPLRSGPVRVELPELRPVKGEPLVSARTAAGDSVMLAAHSDDGVQLAFDPDETVAWLLGRGALTLRAPASARLPFHYHRVPAPMRRILRDLLTRRRAAAVEGYPTWPVEPSVEVVRRIYLAARCAAEPGLEPTPFWPGTKRWALLLSHDVDSAAGLTLAPKQAMEEAERGLVSCWYLVGRRYLLAASPLGELEAAGMELGLHGDTHDNRLAFLAPAEIDRRLDACGDVVERFRMRGFRSPSMLRTNALYDALRTRFSYDSSMPDTGLLPVRNGCGTVFPFEWRGVLVLPLTLPPDGQLLSRGLSSAEILAAWIGKAEWVRAAGGVAFHLTHPEPGFSAEPSMRETFRNFLDWVAAQEDAWHGTPVELASAWRARASSGAPA